MLRPIATTRVLTALVMIAGCGSGAPPASAGVGAEAGAGAGASAPDATRAARPRVVVTTDGEVDDRSSFVRFLLYTTDFDVDGIVATNSVWQKDGHGTGWIHELIDRYAEVRPSLLRHDARYPEADRLRRVVALGNEDRSRLHTVGPEQDTPGSRLIIDVLLDDDPRPVWLQAWGGTNTIAQAFWRLRASHSTAELDRALAKARVYAVADQDSTIWWLRESFPTLALALSYQFTAINYEHEGHPYSDHDMFSERWMRENVKEGHGPLGAAYPQQYFSEGDSPAFLHLVDTGLRSAQDLSWGGWGGRFVVPDPDHPGFRTDAADDGDRLKPLWRWLPAIQNDFAARMDWAVRDPAGANHPPEPGLKGTPRRTVASGQMVTLDATASTDPDGDPLTFRWWPYPGPGSYAGTVAIRGADGPVASLVAPAVREPRTVHVILEVRDGGAPPLTRYERVILTVMP